MSDGLYDTAPTSCGPQAIIDAARQGLAVDPVTVDDFDVAHLTRDADGKVQVHDLRKWAAAPDSKRGTVTFQDPGSFAQYVASHKDDGATAIFGDLDKLSFTAVLDWHGRGGELLDPRWGEHRATAALRRTEEWKVWRESDRTFMPQTEFAEFIRDQRLVVVDPPSSDLLAMVEDFQATSSGDFKSKVNPHNGQVEFTYTEIIDGRGHDGTLQMPERLRLALVPFEGLEPVEVWAQLRWRVREGNLMLGYSLEQAWQIERAAFDSALDDIRTATAIEPYIGVAPGPLR